MKGGFQIYPQALVSLIRLSEAYAKMRLSHRVEQQDVDQAVNLFRSAIMHSSTDPHCGKLSTIKQTPF